MVNTKAREVFVKITGKDGKPRIVDIVNENLKALKGLSTEHQKYTKEQIKSEKDLLSLMTSKARADKAEEARKKAALTTVREKGRLEREIAREIVRTDKLAANDRIRESKRAVDSFIKDMRLFERVAKQSANTSSSFFSKMLGASFFGSLGVSAVSAFTNQLAKLPGIASNFLSEAFNESLKFNQNAAALALFSGSIDIAKQKIAELAKLSADTPGLAFTSAVEGQKRLEAIGFKADLATQLLVGLSKVRVMSGSTKDDFDAMLVNLTQIATGGQKVTQEIREMATRMPGIVAIIKKEFGGIGKELNEIDPKEFLARLAGAMSQAVVAVDPATDSIENLNDAYTILQISVGRVISQNPEMIALLKMWANQINGVTTSLDKQDSQQKTTFSNFISWLSAATVKTQNWAEFTIGVFQDLYRGFEWITTSFSQFATYGANKLVSSFQYAIDQIISIGNKFISGANYLGGTFGLAPVEQMQPLGGEKAFYDNEKVYTDLSNERRKYFETEKGFWKNSRAAIVAGNDRLTEYRYLIEDIKQNGKKGNLGIAGGVISNLGGVRPNTGDASSRGMGATSGGGKKITEKSFQLSKEGQALVNAARKLGVSPLDLATIISFETGGTFNPNIVGGEGGNYRGLIQFGPSERKQFGVTKGQSFESQIETSVVNFFKTRFAVAGRKTEGASLLDLYTTVIAGNPGANKRSEDAFGTSAISGVGKMGRHRQGALKKFFGGNTQNIDDFGLAERVEETSKELIAEAIEKRRQKIFEYVSSIRTAPGEVEGGNAKLGRSVLPQLTPGQEYIKSLRESLNLNERITESTLRRMNHLKVMNVLYEDSVQTQSDDLLNVEEQLALLRRQNADAEFVRNRRALDAKEEQLSAETELGNLQDRLANTPLIDSNRIQIEQTRDLIDLKNRQTDAIIALNRAQLELSQKGVYSEVEANAKVLGNINEQVKSTTDIIADFKIGISDSFFASIDAPFDRLNKQFDKLPEGIRGVANAFVNLGRDLVKAFSHKIIMRLFGLETGGAGAGSGGGDLFSTIFGGLFGGGAGGTPNFNPNLGGGAGGGSWGGWQNARALGDQFRAGGQSGGGGFSSIFGAEGFGNNVGTYGAIGAGAGLLGGLIGGRVGGFISGAGGGLAMGAQIGTMFMPGLGTAIGAGIGALAGGLMSLFGGDPKRKKDKKEHLPALNQGFTDALAQLRQLVTDTKSLRLEPESALAKATELRQQIASGFGIQFESKKYRKQSQSLIAGKLVEADAIIKQIREAADIAGAAGERRRRILPEFADGFAFSNFARRNGLLSGGIAGMDSLPSLLMPGEIVANQRQQNKIRAMAGFDVFAYADIPNYPKPKRMAEGGFVGSGQSINMSPNINVSINMYERADGGFDAYLKTEGGEKAIQVVVNKLKRINGI